MSSKGLVLVTGANGYIAARTLEAFLQAGYSVRGTVRSRSSATSIVKALAQYGDKLQIVEVPDITVEGAFDEAVKGVDAIAHLAAPVSFFFTDPEPVMKGAIHGVSRILESANKEASVKNFVFMSSIAAVFWRKDVDYTFTESDWNNEAEKMVADKGKDAPSPVIYSASKAAAEKAFWKFREEHHPHFSMSAINPCFVAGPSLVSAETPEKISETIGFVWRALTGESLDQITLSGGFAGYVDVRDVARLVVFNVDHPEKTDGERYIAASAYGPPQAVVDILRKAYPERADIIVKGNPGEGYRPDYKFPAQMAFDGTKAVRTTGQEYIPFEKTVLDTAEGLKHLL